MNYQFRTTLNSRLEVFLDLSGDMNLGYKPVQRPAFDYELSEVNLCFPLPLHAKVQERQLFCSLPQERSLFLVYCYLGASSLVPHVS